MKKRNKLFILFLSFSLVVVGVVVIGRARQTPQINTWSLESPGKTYTVHFKGLPSDYRWPFVEPEDVENRIVSINVDKVGGADLENETIYSGSAYDNPFDLLYPDSKWLNENILKLWSDGKKLPTEKSVIIDFENASGEELKYVMVEPGKYTLFLLFDIKSGEKFSFPMNLAHFEELVGCEGIKGGRRIPYTSGNFSSGSPGLEGSHYLVRVTKDGCTVDRNMKEDSSSSAHDE